MVNIVDGVAGFNCEDCGCDIISLGHPMGHHDGLAVCNVCRFIRACPEMPEDVKSKLRGTDLHDHRPPDPRQRN